MATLTGLKNAAPEVTCLFIQDPGEIDVILRNSCAATAASDHGSFNVHKDFDGVVHCEFHRYWITLHSAEFDTVDEAKELVGIYFKALENPAILQNLGGTNLKS